jgi:glycosyltransferase involved in cell wall biosynthesis
LSDEDGSLRLLIAGPLPPPHGGVTGFVALMREHASPHCASLEVFDTSTHSQVTRTGTWSAANVAAAAVLSPKLRVAIHEARPSVVQIEAGGYLGLLKAAALALAARPAPVILSIHSADMQADLARAGAIGRAIIRNALSRARAVRIMYDEQAAHLSALAPSVPPEHFRLIQPFIAIERHGPRPLGIKGRLRAVCVGTVGERKGTFELLDAVAGARATGRDIRCDILGGEEREGEMLRLEALHARLGLSGSVTFHGPVPRDDVRSHLEMADAFVLPSRAEGLPLALMEAMSVGLPLAVTQVGAIGATVCQPDLPPFPPGDTMALQAALTALADDPGLRVRCSEASLLRTAEFLSPEAVIPLFVEMWRSASR